MTYQRVIPRDLFNEANLLKCLGRLWICLDQRRDLPCQLGDEENGIDPGDHTGEAFDIRQNQDGAIYVANLPFRIRGDLFALSRPLNSREPWPLFCESPDGETCLEVFDNNGGLSAEFLKFACAHDWQDNGAGAPAFREVRCTVCGAIDERDVS